MTEAMDDALTIRDPGAVRFRFVAAPLDYPSWLALQTRLMAPHLRGNRLRRILIILAVSILLGGGGGVATAALDLYGALTVVAIANGWSITVDGAKLVILSLALVLVVYVGTVLLMNAWRMRMARRFYQSVSLLGAPGEIVMTENGVLRRGAEGDSFFRWTAITDAFAARGVWFLIVDRGSGLWFRDDAVGAEREAIEAFVLSKIAAPSSVA